MWLRKNCKTAQVEDKFSTYYSTRFGNGIAHVLIAKLCSLFALLIQGWTCWFEQKQNDINVCRIIFLKFDFTFRKSVSFGCVTCGYELGHERINKVRKPGALSDKIFGLSCSGVCFEVLLHNFRLTQSAKIAQIALCYFVTLHVLVLLLLLIDCHHVIRTFS